jgi:hypothetical protein
VNWITDTETLKLREWIEKHNAKSAFWPLFKIGGVPMRFTRLQNAVLGLSLVAVAALAVNTAAPVARAQSAVTGALSGAVSDATGAVVPGATVTVVDTATGAKLVVKSNAEGRYTVGLLKPGLYKVTATAESLKSDTLEVNVILGTTVPGDIKVSPTGSNTVIEVTSTSSPLVDTQDVALATTFNEEQIQNLPTPGGDVTTVAFTAPGVVVNAGTGFGYGNFSSDGLPGISNLFVLNGFDNQDPFLNLNNSGSSNLTLGQGELEEATVVQNGYNSQYGRAAGATINYTTKSGSNKFHGMLDYNYNGTALNANGWFSKHGEALLGDPNEREHAVSNEWAMNVGGPIVRDKLFFFSDFEGLRYVLPGAAGLVTFPSPAFQSYVLSNVNNLGSNVEGSYAQAFAAYQGASSYGSATPLTVGDGQVNGGCGDVAGTPNPAGGYFGAYPTSGASGGLAPCMTEAFESVNNINKEWLYTGRVDWHVSDKHNIYGRYKMDRGSQPTGTSFISPLFSDVSIQPEYEGQFNDSYVISPTKTNVFVAAANWYSAYFGPSSVSGAQALFPWSYSPDLGYDNSGDPGNGAGGLAGLGQPYYFPQGRNVAQYQLEDDFSWIKGKHTMKLGFNFRRDLVEDFDAQVLVDYPLEENLDLATFARGFLDINNYGFTGLYIQNYASQTTAHLALYNVGFYFQDEWQASPQLKLTLGARVDRTGNPLCHSGCFSDYSGSFPNSSASVTEPYNQEVWSRNWHAFPSVQIGNFQPRFGFNYSFDDKTEIRGGVGFFSDLYPASFLDGEIQNFPNVNEVEVLTGTQSSMGAGSLTANSDAGNAATVQGFHSGQNVTDIYTNLSNQGIPFTPPSINAYFPGKFSSPEYTEYSLQFQRQLGKSNAIVVTYAGNYGYNEVINNPDLNASSGEYGDGSSLANPWGAVGNIGGLPATPPDPSFTKVTAYTNDAHSNYNGGMVSFKHNGQGFSGQISYTYSRSMDLISNGGEGLNFNATAVTQQLTPSLGPGNLNYSSSDYDIRNNGVADAVYAEPFKSSNKILNEVAAGWTVGAKTYWRSGEPFSITNSSLANAGFTNLGGTFMAQTAIPGEKLINKTSSDAHSAAYNGNGLGSCSQYVGFDDSGCSADPFVAQTTFGNLRRNSLFGPHYIDTDIDLVKKIVTSEGFTLSIGANAYNVFNQVSFGAPDSTLGDSTFGLISAAVQAPTSPYGSFQGAVVTGRILQVHGKITF